MNKNNVNTIPNTNTTGTSHGLEYCMYNVNHMNYKLPIHEYVYDNIDARFPFVSHNQHNQHNQHKSTTNGSATNGTSGINGTSGSQNMNIGMNGNSTNNTNSNTNTNTTTSNTNIATNTNSTSKNMNSHNSHVDSYNDSDFWKLPIDIIE